MLVIKVWCLPRFEEAQLKQLHRSLVEAVVGIPKFGVKDEKGMVCLFPSDMMQYGLGEEIIVEVTGVKEMWLGNDTESWHQLAARIGYAVREHLPEAHIECFVYGFRPTNGYWSSENSTSRAEVERIYTTIMSLIEDAHKVAQDQCYCKENQLDHKGACSYHQFLGALLHYKKEGEQILAMTNGADFHSVADVYAGQIRKSYVLPQVRKAMGWATAD